MNGQRRVKCRSEAMLLDDPGERRNEHDHQQADETRFPRRGMRAPGPGPSPTSAWTQQIPALSIAALRRPLPAQATSSCRTLAGKHAP